MRYVRKQNKYRSSMYKLNSESYNLERSFIIKDETTVSPRRTLEELWTAEELDSISKSVMKFARRGQPACKGNLLRLPNCPGLFPNLGSWASLLPSSALPENSCLSTPPTLLPPFLHLHLSPYLLPLILSFPLPHVSSESSMPTVTFLNWLVITWMKHFKYIYCTNFKSVILNLLFITKRN